MDPGSNGTALQHPDLELKLEAWGPGEPRGVPGRCRERNEPQVVSCNYQELLPGRWELFSVISVTSFCSEGILSLCLKKLS